MSLLAALISQHIRADAADPHWPDRDRLVMGTHVAASGFAQPVSGPPGLSFGAAVGMAIAERILAARFGRSLVDHRTWLSASAADLASGTAQEAAFVAGELVLGRLTVLASIPSDQPRLRAGFAAAGWTVRVIPMDDGGAAEAALTACQRSQKPTLILQTGTGGGSTSPLFAAAETVLPPSARRGAGARRAWLQRLRRHASRDAFQHALAGYLPPGWQKFAHVEDAPIPGAPAGTTQGTVLSALARLAPVLPDLTGLPFQDGGALAPSHAAAFAGRTLSWEGRGLAAAAALLGMALHGGIMPVGLSPASLLDFTLPALRAGAIHQARWLQLVAGHDEAPAAAIPNLHAYHPADAAEALDCLVLALRRTDGPGLMRLSNAAYTRLPPRTPHLCARGAYLVHAPANRAVTLLAFGPGLAAALLVHGVLAAQGVAAALVSIPCRALFDQQEPAYRASVLGRASTVIFGSAASPVFAGLAGPGALSLSGDADPAADAARIVRHMQCSPPHPAAHEIPDPVGLEL